MKRLLDDLLDVSRITSDKFAIESAEIDLRDSIETAIEATAPLYAERRVKLITELPQRAMPVTGDARRLAQAIANLLSNAATYSPLDSQVTLSVTSSEQGIDIRVLDHGDGIDPDLQPKIFDLFVQSEQKLDRSRGGLGVGLSLVKAIVELHDGSIHVHSDGAGKGSMFRIWLPTKVKPLHLPTITRVVSAGPCRVVLIDDQDDSRDMLRELLQAKNHVVFDGADGACAVQLITEHKPDVAFIDIGLPVMNGFEVAQQVRKHPELRGVVLVALSGYGNKSDVKAALEAGFDEHVTKPAEFKRLEQILARAQPAPRGS